jgi:hypothetical protein
MKDMPQVLYHYCSLDSGIKILQSERLWMTSLFYMNDSLEYRWFTNQATEYISHLQTVSPHDDYPELLQRLSYQDLASVYCFCLSELPDSLGQWRAYADDGNGMAIGFDLSHFNVREDHGFLWARQLHSEDKNAGKAIEACKVCYTVSEQHERLERGLKALKELPFSKLGLLAKEAFIFYEAARCKNPAFAEEYEWRFIYRSFMSPGSKRDIDSELSPLGIILRGKTLVPYFQLPFSLIDSSKPPAIARIVVGPKVNDETIATIKLFFSCRGLDSPEIARSAASYRVL